ncbi:hypothetical protein SE17_15365 [Kouleothrix aurantiaca]|uniref:VCBS repeat-containing protein n=1 Tax=Kouleothrix aurantiaca TaxID=186479 RepID=A0A0P9DA29_9CHLR|nr:hypothetical protein SE17_15365 [Kouleothrix aurantiaca]
MAVRSQEMRNTTTRTGSAAPRASITVPPISFHTLAYVVTAVLALLAIYAIMGNVMSWGQGKVDDFRYGATRTYQVDAVVGHNDGAGTPSHFIAMNLNRQVMVIEIPGGDASKIRTLTGPYLFGAGEDKTPVLLRFDDLNRDGSQDLIVNVKNEEIVYLNKEGQFQPITPEERARLVQKQ